jgi:hypothetical protein
MLVQCRAGTLSIRNPALSPPYLFSPGEGIIPAVIKALRLEPRDSYIWLMVFEQQ